VTEFGRGSGTVSLGRRTRWTLSIGVSAALVAFFAPGAAASGQQAAALLKPTKHASTGKIAASQIRTSSDKALKKLDPKLRKSPPPRLPRAIVDDQCRLTKPERGLSDRRRKWKIRVTPLPRRRANRDWTNIDRRPGQVRGQLRIALNNGVTKDEIVELFVHLEAYAGAARAFDSYQVALEVSLKSAAKTLSTYTRATTGPSPSRGAWAARSRTPGAGTCPVLAGFALPHLHESGVHRGRSQSSSL
jgi:hypothetical protein